MIGFIEGTLLISNALLILFAIFYGILIIRREKKVESSIWIHYFIIACALFFMSELLSLIDEFSDINVGIFKALLRICFGTVILFAFVSEYSNVGGIKKKKH
ncbi:hypothetical protein JXC34_01650 [Candidatus Woesearchaeota archaeon]|nr:hypothetical protein [Candidatus Woesearchaeota archaeon]